MGAVINVSMQLHLAQIYAPVAVAASNVLEIKMLSVQQQRSLHNCELFAIAYATEIAVGG